MNKRIVLIGIVLIVLGIIAAIIASSTFSNSIQLLAGQLLRNATIHSAQQNYAYLPINVTNASQIYVLAELNKSSNFYVFNGSAFGVWVSAVKNATNASGIRTAVSLEGKGAYFIAENSTFVDTASSVAPNSTENIVYAASNAVEPAGTYYAVSDNTNGSASANNGTVLTKLVYYMPGTISSNTLAEYSGPGDTVLASSIAFLALVIAGIILVIYGVWKKPKPDVVPAQFQEPKKDDTPNKPGEKADDYISGLYDRIEGRKGKKKE